MQLKKANVKVMWGKQREKSQNIYSMLPITKWCVDACWETGIYHKWLLQKVHVVNNEFTPPLLLFSLTFYIWADIMWYVASLSQFGWVILVMSSPRILSPNPTGDGGTLERQGWHSASAAQLQPEHWCAISTFPATHAKHCQADLAQRTA